ncbi:MAG: cupin domain-containing protein [Candidatus Woesearchaeota archaeon]
MKTESIINPPESKVLKSGRVVLLPGESVGKHITEKKEELIIVLRGTATLSENGKSIRLKTGETHYIKEDVPHNILNKSNQKLEYIYIVGLLNQQDLSTY